jgi:hypothetical protein
MLINNNIININEINYFISINEQLKWIIFLNDIYQLNKFIA